MIKYRMRKADVLLLVGVLLSALLLFALQQGRGQGDRVVIYVGNEVYGTYPLETDAEIEIAQENGSVNRVRIQHGAVSMAYSTCKNQICVGHGAISDSDEWIVCLPNQVSITVAKEAAQ